MYCFIINSVAGLNVIFRKLANHSKPSMEILAEQDKVKIIARASFFTKTMVLPLDRPYEEEFEGIKMNVRFLVRPQSTKKADNKITSAIFSKAFSYSEISKTRRANTVDLQCLQI